MHSEKQQRQKKKRFTCYVVFRGRKPGVYKKWSDVIMQTEGFKKPFCKGYSSLLAATKAFGRYQGWLGKKNQEKLSPKKYDHVWGDNYFEKRQVKETPTYYLSRSSEQKSMTDNNLFEQRTIGKD